MMAGFHWYSSCACADVKIGFCTSIFTLLNEISNQKIPFFTILALVAKKLRYQANSF